MDYLTEQRKILSCSDELDSRFPGRSWNKYKGDVIVRKIIALVNSHLPQNFVAVCPSCFVQGFPTEIDAVVVSRSCQPIQGTNAYAAKNVVLAIEIKKFGFYCKQSENLVWITRYFEPFRKLGVPFLYITIREGKRKIEDTKGVLKESAFFLAERKPGQLLVGEWERFITKISTFTAIA